MRDPFAPNSKSSMLRDAQVGLLLVAVLLGVFVYVAYYRVTGQGRQLPDHVRMAPVATAVWPNGPPEQPTNIVPLSTSPTTVATSGPPRQPAAKAQTRSNRETPSVKTVTLAPLRTDRHVSPVDFQQPEPAKKPPTASGSMTHREQPLSWSDLKPGNKIDPSKIRRANNPIIFGPRTIAAPPKIVVRQPTMTAKPDKDFAPTSKVTRGTIGPIVQDKKIADLAARTLPNPLATPPKPSPSRPVNSIVERKPKPSPTEKHPEELSIKTANLNLFNSTSDLRPGGARPRMMSPMPSLRPSTKKSNQSLRTTPSSFQPIKKQPNFARQQDIAKVATTTVSTDQEFSPPPERKPANTPTIPESSVPATATSEQLHDHHVSQEGDSFWSLASSRYGDGRFFRALYEWNRSAISDFDRLPAGTKIDIPNKGTLRKRWPDLCPRDEPAKTTIPQQTVADYDSHLSERLYITEDGDTLFDIAAKTLGQASRYVEIISKNDQRLPAEINHLAPLKSGVKLVLPD